ncbi:hypothetical protein NDU88_005354 [Pleurodeles waltl]|uniref:Secreted protein n=1 Tax=Pleurodeles waltl TaxID=8319 RepID=A0AAV7LMF1_PLEWA|nr:hypothetical protein NDU88_005354 [Pleurodeles waltl]
MSCWLLLVEVQSWVLLNSSSRCYQRQRHISVYAGARSGPLLTVDPGLTSFPASGRQPGWTARNTSSFLGARRRPSLKFSGPRWRSSLFRRLLRLGAVHGCTGRHVHRFALALQASRSREPDPFVLSATPLIHLCQDRLFLEARDISG